MRTAAFCATCPMCGHRLKQTEETSHPQTNGEGRA